MDSVKSVRWDRVSLDLAVTSCVAQGVGGESRSIDRLMLMPIDDPIDVHLQQVRQVVTSNQYWLNRLAKLGLIGAGPRTLTFCRSDCFRVAVKRTET